MDRREQVQYLNQTLLAEMPQYREQAEAFPVDAFSQRRLLRSLMNVRPPMPLAPEFLKSRMPSCPPSGRKRAWWTGMPCRPLQEIPA